MNILMLTANDPAGMGISFCRAINRQGKHRCRLITTETRYNFEFEKDIHVPDCGDLQFDEIEALLRDADIFHFHILSDENMKLGPLLVRDFAHGKKILHHHHGHPYFKENPHLFREKYRRLRRKAVVSTPDLLKLLPAAQWVPNLVPIQDPLYLPLTRARTGNGAVKVGHSPTRRDLKKTDVFERVMDRVSERNEGVEKVIISDTLHRRCLELKKECDIFFDQLGPSFGVSSLEALSQGLPTIARLDEQNLEEIRRFTATQTVPWVNAEDEEELESGVEEMVLDRGLREERGAASRRFMEEHWREEQVLERLFEIYESL
jgi:glycosyltransferase involved in cell wall biosynthesis